MRSVIILLACCCLLSETTAQSSFNMEYFGNWNDTSIPSVGYGRYSACWGYTAPNGREYALIGTYTGTAIIDITDSVNIVKVAYINGPPSNWREMKTFGTYAYIVTENATTPDSGIQIIDLSNLPASAARVANYVWVDTIPGSPATFVAVPHAHTISANGNFLYLNGGGGYQGIRILDVSDPLNPQKVGKYSGPYIHDSFIRSDTIFASAIHTGGGLDIIDARNKTNPSRIKLLQYPGSGTHNAWTTDDGKFLLTTDEIGSTPKTLKIWDVHDIQNPSKVAEVASVSGNDTAIVHNVVVRRNLAYVAWYTAGVKVVDITDPTNPIVVGYYDTYPQNNIATYAGVWGVFPFYPSGKFIVSDMQTGLHVMRYKPTPTSVEVVLTPANYVLYQNYPNPFNPRTTIAFDLPKESHASLALYNLFGQEIRILAQGRFSPGTHRIDFDAGTLASGVYFYTLKTPEFTSTRRMVLVK